MQVATARHAFLNALHCGDDCAYWQRDEKSILCIVDGLGHGEPAEEAAKAALRYVSQHLSHSLIDIFAGCDSEIRCTRGVAMGIAVIGENAGQLTYAGVGNTRAVIMGDSAKHLINSYGIVGGGYRTLSPQSVPVNPGDLVIMSTDGMPDTIDLTDIDAATLADIQWLPEKLIEQCSRGSDDAAVLIYRIEER